MDWLELIKEFQTGLAAIVSGIVAIIVGIFGFLGVTATLKNNAALSRDLAKENAKLARDRADHEAELAREKSKLEVDLAKDELQNSLLVVFRYALTVMQSSLDRKPAEDDRTWLIRKPEYHWFDLVRSGLGLLNPKSGPIILGAALDLETTSSALEILKVSTFEGTTEQMPVPAGWVAIPPENFSPVEGVISSTVFSVETAIEVLERDLRRSSAKQ